MMPAALMLPREGEAGGTLLLVGSIAGALVVLAVVLAIAFWPKDNSF